MALRTSTVTGLVLSSCRLVDCSARNALRRGSEVLASSHVVNVSSTRYRYVRGAWRTLSLRGSPRRSHHALMRRKPGHEWSTA
ncbi:hypothetical protein ACUW97_002410 [Kocuria rhizophila]